MRLSGLALVILVCDCAGLQLPRLTAQRSLDTPAGHFLLQHEPGVVSDANQTLDAVKHAGPSLLKWGRLKSPVTVQLLPTHADLERAVHRRGYPWLRAWGRYDDVLLQTPSTWNATDANLTELLTHELTHCLMYQRAGTAGDWASKGIPLWFREGMASWTAEQSQRWISIEALAKVYAEGPASDPIVHGEDLYRDRSDVVYAAAHHAFTFLVSTYGTPAIEALLDAMGRGASFREAFKQAIGVDEAAFIADFKDDVLWRGTRVR